MIITALLLTSALVLAQISEEYEVARREYVDDVRTVVEVETLTQEQVDRARAAIVRLVRTGQAPVLDSVALDAKKAAQKLLDVTMELESSRVEVTTWTDRLPDLSGDEKEKAGDRIKELNERIGVLEPFVPLARSLREALFEGLLEIIDRAPAVDPERAFVLLVAYFKDDTRRFYRLDQSVRDSRARAATYRERIVAETNEEKKARLERNLARVESGLEILVSELERAGQLKERRIQVLSSIYPELPDGVQSRELKAIHKNIRDDIPWESRAVHVELLGFLPVDSAVADVVRVLKRAARTRQKSEQELGALRERYDRALEALTTAIKGGNGSVPSPVAANKNQTERALRKASNQVFGESRVLESASAALGHALAGSSDAERPARLDTALKLVSKDPDAEVRARVIDALGGVRDDKVGEALRDLTAGSGDLRLRLAALDALGRQQDDKTVELCVTRLLTDPEWRIRAAAMRTLVAIPRKNSIPALIQSVGSEVGRLVDDAEWALTALTGRRFNADPDLWKEWWRVNRDSFKIGDHLGAEGEPSSAVASGNARSKGGHISFYGIQTRSNRILFVLDRSGSMDWPLDFDDAGGRRPGRADMQTKDGKGRKERRLDAALAQLKSALSGLEGGDVCNIITYAADVTAWQRKMTKVTDKSKRKLDKYVTKSIEAVGGTNIHDALREAFRMAGIGSMDKAYRTNVDTIFFLTDGQPTVGEVTDPNEILKRVAEWNRLARIVVHTVGVGKGHDGAFLRRLAEENGGQYTSR